MKIYPKVIARRLGGIGVLAGPSPYSITFDQAACFLRCMSNHRS
jgi:hypothetical protein